MTVRDSNIKWKEKKNMYSSTRAAVHSKQKFIVVNDMIDIKNSVNYKKDDAIVRCSNIRHNLRGK